MNELYIFFLTSAISFAGSVQPGPLNVMVIRTSLQHNLKAALLLSLGGCLPEFLYSFLALVGVSYINDHPQILTIIDYLVIPIFILFGFYFLFKKQKEAEIPVTSLTTSFSKGLMISMLNPQLLPFWFGILLYLNSLIHVTSLPTQIAFILGTAFGAMVLLSLYAWLAWHKKDLLNRVLGKLNFDKLMAVIFFGLAIIKAASFFIK